MKKITFLGLMLFIIFSHVFADGNTGKFENIFFSCQINNRQESYPKISFVNLNPMFYNNYLLIDINKNIVKNIDLPNNRNSNTYENDMCSTGTIFTAIMYTGAIFATWSMNRQEQEIQNDMWKQQKEAERIFQNIKPDGARNFYNK